MQTKTGVAYGDKFRIQRPITRPCGAPSSKGGLHMQQLRRIIKIVAEGDTAKV